MMNANNTYFENLKRIDHEWEAARVERKARKQQIIDALGWDSDELKAWYEEDAAAKFPFESGVSKAYRAWAQSLSRKENELEMDDFLWDKEVADFISSLLLASIHLCMDVARLSPERWAEINNDSGSSDLISDAELKSIRETLKVAILYALGYLYEHREEADHHDLTLTLRSLLFAIREGGLR